MDWKEGATKNKNYPKRNEREGVDMAKPKVAFYWNASCGGCEEAIVDLAEDILKVVEAVDIVLWPVALDFKYKDVEAMKDGEIAVSFINGAIRTEEQEHISKLLRKKSQLVIAFGSCAHIGGIPGLANFYDRDSIFQYVYHDSPTTKNLDKVMPQKKVKVNGYELNLPEFYDTVKTLDQTIDVDYYIPGCAPPPDIIMNAVTAILEGKLPEKGSVLAPAKSLCDTCPRGKSKPAKLSIKKFNRIHKTMPDTEKCFLEEGILCLGPATRSGCGERCINANMPCRGCFGPTNNSFDQGGKMLSAFASLIDAENEEEERKLIESIVDPAGLLYMYSLPASLLRRRRKEA
jgi:F420-non-reducing hydrogenase small subunit